MKRTLSTLALVAAAGTAGAQTATPPDSTNDSLPSTATAPADQPTGAAATARKRIEHDGYKNVHNLAKGADGLWHGTAMRGGTQVQVTVDRAGNVTAQ